MKAETKDTVDQKINEVRASIQADKADKIAGEGNGPRSEEQVRSLLTERLEVNVSPT